MRLPSILLLCAAALAAGGCAGSSPLAPSGFDESSAIEREAPVMGGTYFVVTRADPELVARSLGVIPTWVIDNGVRGFTGKMGPLRVREARAHPSVLDVSLEGFKREAKRSRP